MKDDPVMKQKGLTTPLTRTALSNSSGTQLNKVVSNGDRPGLSHAETGSSMGSLNSITRINTAAGSDALLFPFRVKHLGHEVYTLYAASQQDRELWCSKIIEAKTQHAKALHAQNAEPFRLRVLADGAFAYDSVSAIGKAPGVPIRGTPLDRSIREIEKVYGAGRGPPAVCRAQVNCATAFTAFGKSLIAIGTDYGVYVSEASNPRGWTRVCWVFSPFLRTKSLTNVYIVCSTQQSHTDCCSRGILRLPLDGRPIPHRLSTRDNRTHG